MSREGFKLGGRGAHLRRLAVRNTGAREKAIGYIIMLLGSLFSLVVPVVHMKGKAVGITSSGHSSGHFFFVWTLIAIGVIGLFSAILAQKSGAPGAIPTRDLSLRRRALYAAELREHE